MANRLHKIRTKPDDGSPRPHPYSEAADHDRRDRADPGRAARGLFRWTFAVLALALLIGVGFCSAQAQQFFIRYEGDQNRVDIEQSTGGGVYAALMQFNAWAANDTRVGETPWKTGATDLHCA